MNGAGTLTLKSSETIATKRQRRPSVRLGDIGVDPPYESQGRRNISKGWKVSFDPHRKDKDSIASGKSSKTRPLTNLSSVAEFNETLEPNERETNIDTTVAIGSWKVKESKKRGGAAKRVRSNWVSRIDEGGGSSGAGVGAGTGEGGEKYSGDEDMDDGYREFDVENSESLLKEQSPIHSMENLGVDGNMRSFKSRDHNDGIELSVPSDRNENGGGIVRSGEDGVRIWLNGLGLGRYAPVFEVHEVDDEILPMLTLEDLKDMGINAVGSRRKMYCAIQKLGKGFS